MKRGTCAGALVAELDRACEGPERQSGEKKLTFYWM